MKSQGDRKGPRGAVAVEFGRILPALLVILRGIVETGLALYDRTLMVHASINSAPRVIWRCIWTPYGAVSPPKLVQ